MSARALGVLQLGAVDGSETPGHVEVELTTIDPHGGKWWHRRGDAGADRALDVPPAGDDREQVGSDPGGRRATASSPDTVPADASLAERALATELSRLVATGFAVGVTALLVGILIGRGSAGDGSGDAADRDEAVESTVPRTTSTLLSGEVVPDVGGVGPPTTRTTEAATSSTLAPAATVATRTIELSPLLDGAELVLSGVRRDGTVVEVDVASSTVTTSDWGRGLSMVGGPVAIGDGWIVVADANTGTVLLRDRTDTESRPVSLGDAWNLVHVPGTDLFWRQGGGAPQRFELVDRHGVATGDEIVTDGLWPIDVDPAGGLIAVVQGSTYRLDPSGVSLIGRGHPLAVGEAMAVLRVCDDTLACRAVVVDRSTGDVRPLAVDATADRELGIGIANAAGAQVYWPGVGSVSPAGTWAVVPAFDVELGRAHLAAISLADGSVVDLGAAHPPTGLLSEVGMAWSPDGRLFLFTGPGGPVVFDTGTGRVDSVGGDLGPWLALGLAPSSGRSAPVTDGPESAGSTAPTASTATIPSAESPASTAPTAGTATTGAGSSTQPSG